jgi:hypothetical protein
MANRVIEVSVDISLTQLEADELLAMEKHAVDPSAEWTYPHLGGSIAIPLESKDKREQFLLDISRGKIDLLRGKYQNRSRQIIVLARLDFGGRPHRNPDNEEIPCPHLHIYREHFALKWAVSLPQALQDRSRNLMDLLDAFMDYCTISTKPNVTAELFE